MSGTNLTSNINMLSPTGFKLTINREKFANTEFFITSFGIPSLSAGEVQTNFQNNIGFTPGEVLTFEALSLRFVIDEDMNNYTEMFNWMKANTDSVEETPFAPAVRSVERHDMILSIMTNKNLVNKQFQFKDAFPTALSGVEFSAQSTDVEYLQADVTFRYNEFAIIK
tara:strand:+ start:237 stop:740 length:504 start_codon:yes stop_codon:yes gene_type:complete